MLAATVPAARGSAMPPDRAPGGWARVPGGTRKGPVRNAEAGLAEVMGMPAIWRDAVAGCSSFGPGFGGRGVRGAARAAAPAPAWTAGDLEAAGGAASLGRCGGDRLGLDRR